MRTLIVTDSSACVRPSLARQLGIRVVPIGIVFEDGTEERDDTVAPERVHRALARQESLKSTPPSVLDYLEAVEREDRGPAEHALVLTPAAEFTVMYRTARVAADLADRPVTVVDTRTAASAQGLVVLAAARAAAGGAAPHQVVAAAEDSARRVRLVAGLDTLTTLEHGGLVPSPSLEMARRAGARPVFAFRNGAVQPVGDAGSADMVDVLAAECTGEGGAPEHATVFHAGAATAARRLRERLSTPEAVARFSPAMTLHTGVGLVGIAWLAE